MNHYTYLITYINEKFYIGVRSCKCPINEDTAYIGSSKYTPNNLFKSKEILGVFSSRKEAVEHEIMLHSKYNVALSPDYYNKSNQTNSKFDTKGISFPRSNEHNEKIKKALTGRKRSEKEILAISKGKKGKPRKPHTAEARLNMSKARMGHEGYMKGKKYTSESRQKSYASRIKYIEKYNWINIKSNITEYMTCVEMGYKYVNGPKPSQRFTNIIKGISKSYKGWVLNTNND